MAYAAVRFCAVRLAACIDRWAAFGHLRVHNTHVKRVATIPCRTRARGVRDMAALSPLSSLSLARSSVRP